MQKLCGLSGGDFDTGATISAGLLERGSCDTAGAVRVEQRVGVTERQALLDEGLVQSADDVLLPALSHRLFCERGVQLSMTGK